MSFYTEIFFNAEYFLDRFKDSCKNCNEYALRETINSLSGSPVWKNSYIEYINDSQALIMTDSIQAFIQAFGSGKYADVNSPFWKSYTNSDIFNKRRGNRNDVLFRNQPYTTYDWENDSRSLIDRPGGNRTGVWVNYPAVKGNEQEFRKALDKYQELFFQYFNQNELLNLQNELISSFKTEVKNV